MSYVVLRVSIKAFSTKPEVIGSAILAEPLASAREYLAPPCSLVVKRAVGDGGGCGTKVVEATCTGTKSQQSYQYRTSKYVRRRRFTGWPDFTNGLAGSDLGV